ncbi:MAG: AAA family ATPase [Dehalococcoidia bacterium]|nr:AAA family ATPase [Dehalococcoidia bacterium]
MQPRVVDDLESFLAALPPAIREVLEAREDRTALIEVVLDLGRPPQARFHDSELGLGEQGVTEDDLQYVISRVGEFGGDNRAGIERTLHRISALRNRKGRIVGLTCRVGRALFGTIRVIEDLVFTGKSILLLGRPGVGKTTMLREVARVLADAGKRVVIVDTSNEIAGDGDVPHPAIGRARRMQVGTPALQHAVMIEAVENHMPEVIVIDEMSTDLEAQAARTIAERGVQLIATAHGNTLENLVMNPTMSDLVGGVQTVILGDVEARRRRTQKTVLERKAPPTFPILVEIQGWDKVAVNKDVAETVDLILRGVAPSPEIRAVDTLGRVRKSRPSAIPIPSGPTAQAEPRAQAEALALKEHPSLPQPVQRGGSPAFTRVLPFGVSRSRLEEVAKGRNAAIQVVRDLKEADVLLTTKNYYRRSASTLRAAESEGKPIYVLRKNTVPQMEEFLRSVAPNGESRGDPLHEAMQEAEGAVRRVFQGEREVDLAPQTSYIRRLQHLVAQRSQVASRSRGREPHRGVTIFGE